MSRMNEEITVIVDNNEVTLDLLQLTEESFKILIQLQISDENDRKSLVLVG